MGRSTDDVKDEANDVGVVWNVVVNVVGVVGVVMGDGSGREVISLSSGG